MIHHHLALPSFRGFYFKTLYYKDLTILNVCQSLIKGPEHIAWKGIEGKRKEIAKIKMIDLF